MIRLYCSRFNAVWLMDTAFSFSVSSLLPSFHSAGCCTGVLAKNEKQTQIKRHSSSAENCMIGYQLEKQDVPITPTGGKTVRVTICFLLFGDCFTEVFHAGIVSMLKTGDQ